MANSNYNQGNQQSNQQSYYQPAVDKYTRYHNVLVQMGRDAEVRAKQAKIEGDLYTEASSKLRLNMSDRLTRAINRTLADIDIEKNMLLEDARTKQIKEATDKLESKIDELSKIKDDNSAKANKHNKEVFNSASFIDPGQTQEVATAGFSKYQDDVVNDAIVSLYGGLNKLGYHLNKTKGDTLPLIAKYNIPFSKVDSITVEDFFNDSSINKDLPVEEFSNNSPVNKDFPLVYNLDTNKTSLSKANTDTNTNINNSTTKPIPLSKIGVDNSAEKNILSLTPTNKLDVSTVDSTAFVNHIAVKGFFDNHKSDRNLPIRTIISKYNASNPFIPLKDLLSEIQDGEK